MVTSLPPDAELEASRHANAARAKKQRYALAASGITVLLACTALLYYVNSLSHTLLVDSASDFKFITGLVMPKGALVVRTADDHGGFHGDGEFYLVFKADRKSLVKLLADEPPWGDRWQTSPVPGLMGFGNQFGWQSKFSADEGHAAIDATRPDRAAYAFHAPSMRYSAQERCCQTLPWHNGSLLIVDPESGYVWLSVWDF
ncbi:MAG: hypothetical protein K2Y37_15680 [Pirellulales bacterium]|nr:hypothetical protein [Pirellulales bacterium]